MVESKQHPLVVLPPRSLLETFFRQTQTRILLLYVVLLGAFTGWSDFNNRDT